SCQLQTLARHPEEMEQARPFQPVGPGTEGTNSKAYRLEVTGRLDELVLSSAGSLERKRRGVQQHRTLAARTLTARPQPGRAGLHGSSGSDGVSSHQP